MKNVEPTVGKEIRKSSPLEHLLIVVVSVYHIYSPECCYISTPMCSMYGICYLQLS